MCARKLLRSASVLVLVLSVFSFVVDVEAHGPPWPVIDGVFEALWESGEPFDLWRGGDPNNPNPLIDGTGWALWNKSLSETEARDVYVAIWMNSPITDSGSEENWIRANTKNGLILIFEEFAWLFSENGDPIGWESRVEVPANVCWIYVHTVTGPGGVETAGGSFDICDPTEVTLTSIGASFWPVAVLPLLVVVSLVAVVRRPRKRHLLC